MLRQNQRLPIGNIKLSLLQKTFIKEPLSQDGFISFDGAKIITKKYYFQIIFKEFST